MDKNNFINKSLNYLFVSTNILLLFFFFIIKDYIFFFQSKIIIFLIIITFTIPSIKYYFSKNFVYLPIGEIILMFFILAYIAIFFYSSDNIDKSYTWLFNDISKTEKYYYLNIFENNFSYLKYLYVSCISFYIGFELVKKIKIFNGFFSNKVEKYFNFSKEDLFFIGSIFLIIKIIFFIFPEINNLSIINNFKSIIFLFSVSCFWTFFLIKKENYFKKLFIVLSLLSCFFIDLIETGSQIGITLMLSLMVLIYWFIKKKIFFFGIFLILFNFYFFQDIKINYREDIASIREDLRKPFFKVLNYSNNIGENLQLLKKNDFTNKNNVSNVRLTISSFGFTKLIQLKNANQLNEKKGETYQNLIFFIIPRFFWENKPVSSHGIEFGLITEITDEKSPTSINVAWISEAFWNFGYLFFIPMLIKGILIGLISIGVNSRHNLLILTVWLTSSVHLIIPESNFSLMFVSFIYQLVFLMMFLTIYKVINKK